MNNKKHVTLFNVSSLIMLWDKNGKYYFIKLLQNKNGCASNQAV